MTTKADIINRAFEDLRISGLTVSQGPQGNVWGLYRLEDMMAELWQGRNFNVNYNFEQTPDINSDTGVDQAFNPMMAANLAIRLVPLYNKQIPPQLDMLAKGTSTSAFNIVSRMNTQPVLPSWRMPRGSGNTIKEPTWQRFMRPVQYPPTLPNKETIWVGEIQDYESDFSAWLGTNTISSFSIAVDPGLLLVSSSSSGGVITYTVQGQNYPAAGVWNYLQITVTDSAGRVNIRFVNFEVLSPPEVP